MSTQSQLARSHPEAQGIVSRAILDFVSYAEQNIEALHSLMLLRHGHVVAEGWWSPYGRDIPHMLFSLSKSFTSTGIGLAVAEGRLTVDDPILQFFPEDAPAKPSEHLKAMRVRHLLAMYTGHDQDTTGHLHDAKDGNWARAFLELPVEHEPGTHFLYNTGATYILSAIITKLTGMPLLDYLTPRLFEPLGIAEATWETCPRGINTGGFGLSIKTEDIARFGQLYLQKGMWQERRILSEAWVAEASMKHSDNNNGTQTNNDWIQGYGYQFWRCRHNGYRGDGAFGQYCIVMPDQDAVLAITSGVSDMQQVLNAVWDILLPAMQPASLPEDPTAQADLNRKLVTLALAPAQGQAHSPLAAHVSGKTYALEPNEQKAQSVALTLNHDSFTFSVRDARGIHQINGSIGAWQKGVTTLEVEGSRKVAASGAWTSDDTFTIKTCMYETPFRPTVTLHFEQDRVKAGYKMNVGFGPTTQPAWTGVAQS
ncbi:MAG: beta-lactamase family protein [Chloroflexi bacterium]|nr:beta-lactamase family protein [Chloroflexota bacterium]